MVQSGWISHSKKAGYWSSLSLGSLAQTPQSCSGFLRAPVCVPLNLSSSRSGDTLIAVALYCSCGVAGSEQRVSVSVSVEASACLMFIRSSNEPTLPCVLVPCSIPGLVLLANSTILACTLKETFLPSNVA